MQCSLFVLILMGQCSLSVCQLYDYYFIKEDKTWDDAREYCRQHYTDLATVPNMTDMMRLCYSTNNPEEAWIGLQNQRHEDKTWHWSMAGVEFNDSEAQWDSGEPNDCDNKENCVVAVLQGNKWNDIKCKCERKFICYNETNQTPCLIEDKMTWLKAQNYCRENHTDLISGRKQLEKLNKTRNNGDDNWWIGLFRDTWGWSDGNNASFRNWDVSFNDEHVSKTCALTLSNGKWSSDECQNKKPFFCYDDNVILINKRKTWEEALYYCRDKHHDLVSITNLEEQRWVQEKAKMAITPYVWLGLRYTCTLDFWFWINDETVSYKNWDSPNSMDECDMSGAMDKGGQHKWVKENDMTEFNFICFKR